MDTAEERATELFIHYFRLIASQAGVAWDYDNDGEIRAAIEYLLDAAVDRTLLKGDGDGRRTTSADRRATA
jgi:hypothetical protein